MKRKLIVPAVLLIVLAVALTGCAPAGPEGNGDAPEVTNITAQEGLQMMEDNPDIILLDVRTEGEYKAEHIPGATLLPVDNLTEQAAEVIPDKDAVYIVYCRSGNRSATSALMLIDLGYTKVYDMGGIIDWPYATESGL